MFDMNSNNAYGGMYYNTPQNNQYQVKQPSTLTPEEYQRLSKQENQFSLGLTETEQLKGICNHRRQDGLGDTLVQDPDGTVRCELCGYRFNPVDTDVTKEDINASVANVIDILQTVKMLYIDMPVQTQREYFQIIPLLEKIPQLFDIAVRDYSKHENHGAWAYKGANMGTMNLFNMLSGSLGASQPMYGQPYNPYGQPAAGFQGQPMPQAPLGSVPPMSNGFGFNGGPAPVAPPQGYAPQTNNFQYNPYAQPVAPQQPVPYQPVPAAPQAGVTAPAEQTSQTDGQTVTTQANFKA